MGVPSRPWVRAWASSSVSRRVEGPLPARDLGLGRRQRPRELGKGAAVSSGGPLKATGKAKRYSPSPGPAACPPGLARQGARADQAGMGGQQAGEEEE